MINKLLATALIVILATFFMPSDAWQNSVVIIEAMGYRISTNWMVIGGSLLTLILVWRLLIAVPRKISFYYHKICTQDHAAILQGLLLALYNHQAKPAAKLISKLKSDLSPSVKILNIQAMQLQQAKPDKVLEELNKLVLDSNAKIFALEELIKIYADQGNWMLVEEYAANLWALSPSPWLLATRIFAMFQLGTWDEVISFAKLGLKAGVLEKDAFRQLQAIARYKMAYALQDVDTVRAIKVLEQAIDMEVMQPYILMMELQIKHANVKGCIDYAKKAWKHSPDHCIAKRVLLLIQHLSPKEFYSVCRDITASHKDHYESLLLMARAYMLLDDLIQANALLHKAVALQQDQRAYMLLARCCHLAHGSVTEIYDWLNKACNANAEMSNKDLYWDISKMKYSSAPSDKSIVISIY